MSGYAALVSGSRGVSYKEKNNYPLEIEGMLILTRRVGESLMVGNDVSITVLAVKGNQVRIGINAPKNVAVHREEIFERIKREQEATKKTTVTD